MQADRCGCTELAMRNGIGPRYSEKLIRQFLAGKRRCLPKRRGQRAWLTQRGAAHHRHLQSIWQRTRIYLGFLATSVDSEIR